jgi:hypothetical protein
VTHLSEITGMEEDVVSMQDIFVFDKQGICAGWAGAGFIPGYRHSTQVCGSTEGVRHKRARLPGSSTRSRFKDFQMLLFILLALLCFGVVYVVLRPTKTETAVQQQLENIQESGPKKTGRNILKEKDIHRNPEVAQIITSDSWGARTH